MTEITAKIQDKTRKPELLDEELDDPMKLIFGMPLETHDPNIITEEEDEDYSLSGLGSLPNLPLPQPRLPIAINDAYVKYGRLCKSKVYDGSDLAELSKLAGCSTGQLEEIFIGSHPLSEKLFNRINDVLGIGPYELKHNHAKIF